MSNNKVDLRHSLGNLMDLMNENIKALKKQNTWANTNPKISDVLYTTNQMNHLKYVANKFPITRQLSDQSSTTTSSSHERLNLKNYNGVIIRENFKGGDYLSNGIINANPTNLKKKNKVTFSQDTNYYDVDMKTPRWDKYWWGAMGRCMKCSKATTPLDAIQIGDRSWHTWCLKCEHCWMTLDNKSSVKLFQGNVFCPRCYANLLTTLKVAPWKSPFFFSNPDLFNSIPARDSWFGPKYFSDHFHLWNKLTGNHIYENQDMIWEHYYSNGYDRFDLLHQKRFASTLLYENLDDPFLPYLPPGHFSPHFALTAPSRSVKPFVPPLPPPIGHSLPLIPASRGLPPPPPPISRLGGPPPPPISRLSRPPPPPISRHNRPPPPPLRRHSRPLLPPSSSRPPPIPNGYKAPPPPPPPPPPPMQRTSSNMVAQNSNNGAESKPTSSISSIVSTKKSLQRLSNGKFVMVKPAANQNGVNLNKATVFTKAAATWKSHIGGSTRAAEKLEDFGGPSSKTHTYVNQEMIWKNNRITKKSNTNGNSTAVKTSPFHNKSNIKRTDSVVVNKPNTNNISNNAPKPINGRRVPPPAPVKKRPPPPPPPSRQVPPPPVPQNSYKHHLMDHYRYEQLQYLDWIQDEEELKEYFNRYHTYANAELFWKHTPSRVTTSVGPTNKHRQRNGAKNTPNASMEPLDELREKPNMGRKILQQPVYDANESLAEMNELKKRLMSPFNERPEESDDDSAKSSPKIVELESDTSTDDIKTPRKTKRKESESSYQSVMSSAQDAWMEEYGVPIAAENDKNKNWIENNKESTFVDTGFAKPNYSDNKNVIREEAFNLRGTNSLKRTILRQSKKTAEEKNKKLTSANEEILEKKNTWNRVFQQIKVTGEFKRRGQSAKNNNSNVDDQKPLSDFENDQKQVFEKLDSMLKDESRKMGEQFYTELHNNNNVITTSEPVKAKLPFRNIKKERSLTEINVSKERIPEENDVNHEMSQNDNDQPSEILEKSPRHPPPANRVLHRANTEAVTINHSNNQDTLSEQGTYKRKSVSFASPNMMRSNTIADIHVTDSEVEGIGDHFESSQRQDPLGESTTSIKNIPQINTSPSKTYNKSDVTARVNQLLNAKINKVLNRNNLNSNEPEIIDNGADNLNINFDANSPVNVDVRERANSSSSRSRSPSPNNAQRMSRTASPSLTNIPVTNSRSSSPSSHNIPMSPRNASQSPIAMPSENVRSNSPSLHNAQITSRSGSPAITQHSNNASPNASNENLSKTQNILANGNQDKKIMIAENDDPSDNIDVGFLDIHTSEDNSFYNEIEKEGLAERQGGILPPHRNSLGSDLDTYSSLMASQASSRYSPLITSTSKIISSISPAKHFTTDLVLIRKDETPTEEEKSSTLKHRRDDDAHLERSFGGDSNIVKTDENNNNNNNNKNIQEKKKLSKKLKFWKK